MGGWRKPGRARTDVLKLDEVVLLRRLLGGESQVEAARALGLSKNVVTGQTRSLRLRFEVATNAELLALPRVLEQLGGES
jgi:DNA-binding CsgD family transcriptional regulator